MKHDLSFEEQYQAMMRKDPDYEGSFITGVKTTGIFCRPTCHAKKPKRKNVVFFQTVDEALMHGYRPCKVCKPITNADETPTYIAKLVSQLNNEPYLQLKDRDLVERGIEPHKIRRWFLKHHGITFHAFRRMLRINTAFRQISAGCGITDAAFDTGHNSLSGFNTGFQQVFGKPPSKAKSTVVIDIARFTTTLGPMFACASKTGLCLLEFTNRRMLEREFKDLAKRMNAVILPGENPFLEQVQHQISEYFNGDRQTFSIPLHTPGSEFQQKVWQSLHDIPYGTTTTYKKQACSLGNEAAVRAVASANGMNRIAIIIPCHRVIGEQGNLTGYAGGLARKKWLIDHERHHSGKSVQKKIAF
jgi:AraC family transcriptional regulator of adaptative response/methylated-DNA-[protein]-cysteine methyltransferase